MMRSVKKRGIRTAVGGGAGLASWLLTSLFFAVGGDTALFVLLATLALIVAVLAYFDSDFPERWALWATAGMATAGVVGALTSEAQLSFLAFTLMAIWLAFLLALVYALVLAPAARFGARMDRRVSRRS